jgi:hypothetical protein
MAVAIRMTSGPHRSSRHGERGRNSPGIACAIMSAFASGTHQYRYWARSTPLGHVRQLTRDAHDSVVNRALRQADPLDVLCLESVQPGDRRV